MLLTITLFSFASGLSFMKMFGIGTALAVVIDATIIRGVVVPAFLRLAGDLNWWAPRPLRWLHSRIGISEAPSEAEVHVDASADAAVPPAPAGPPGRGENPLQSVQKTVEAAVGASPAKPRSEVEVIPGRHLVASVNGTIIVVAHRDRAPLSQNSLAAQQLAALVDMVRRTDAQKLVEAFKKIAREPWSHTRVEVGIVMPTQASLEILLCGSVTVALDNGIDRTLLHGR